MYSNIFKKFQELALQVQTTIQSNARNKLHPLTSWSQRLSRIQNWPFVTINEFSGQATSIHGASQVSFHPLVVWKDQALWERYSMEHVHEWMVESSSFNTNDTTGAFSSKYNNNSISPFINHGLYQPVRATSPSRPTPYYVPYWQIYPIVESLINFDALVFDFGWAAFKGVLQQNANSSSVAAVWSAPVNLKPFRDGVPKSVVAVPIFNNNHNKLVGVFLAMMSWESLLENIQPPGRLEIVVTSPNCQEIIPSMTYAISTSKEEESSNIVFMELDEDTKREGGSVLSVEDDDIVWETACPPTITLYPTEELVSAFQTSDHAKAMVWIVVAGCVLTALLFGGYIVWKRGGKHQQQPPRTTTTPYLFVDRFTEDREQHPSQKSQQQQQHSDESQPFELVSVAPSLPQGDDLSFDLHNIDDSQNAIQPTDDYEFNASEPSIQLFHPSSSFDDDLIKKQVSLVRITARRTSSPPPTPLPPQETITTTNYTSKATPSSCHILQPSEDGVWKPSIFHLLTTGVQQTQKSDSSPLDSSITLSSLQPQRNSDPTSRINPKSSMKRQNAPGLPRKVVSIQPPSSKPMTIYDISNHSIDLTQQKLEKEKENEKNPLFKVVPDDKPIANLYPSCTVLFADLVGFTSWSAHHSPTEVFQLLETLYGSFDRIAKRRGVFKVETIGDCYVAVTGVPLVKPDHAVAMARFCRDCMIAMRQAVEKLSETLGTAELGMRFGLHSGPVTGGVLRGLKSRFQLFGDTIAKASKIESLGQKDKIHVSQKSALLMIQAGKNHWLQEREKPIEVLGEMMQTYWLSFDPARLNVSSGYINYENDEDKNNDNSLDEYGLHDSDLDDEIIDELSKEFGMPRETGLANLYPDCTLFFAEVDGFVDWSASKEPEQVLWLLEGIYKAFDKIAKRRSIFKVETIADCYVAAAGLPMERSDHAVAMARFARECMLAVDPVLQSLKQKVGGDVVNLGMRFGLHRYVWMNAHPSANDNNKSKKCFRLRFLFVQRACYSRCVARRKITISVVWGHRQYNVPHRNTRIEGHDSCFRDDSIVVVRCRKTKLVDTTTRYGRSEGERPVANVLVAAQYIDFLQTKQCSNIQCKFWAFIYERWFLNYR